MPGCIKNFLLFVLICFFGLVAYGQQNLKLNLKLISRDDNAPLMFAKISLVNAQGNAEFLGLSDTEGKYIFVVPEAFNGKLRLTTSPIGYEGYTSSVLIFTKGYINDTVYLIKKAIALNEVKIVQQQIIKDGEKLIYRPKLDQFSASTSSVELFSKLPGISLVGGKLKLNGKEGTLILIDGRGELASQAQQLEILTALGSDKIEKIEVISTASSRYDANITSIINVITKKEKGNSTLRGNFSQPLYMNNKTFGNEFLSGGASTNLNFKVRNVRASLLFNINNTRRLEDSDYKNVVYDVLSYNYTTNSKISRFVVSPNLTLDYDINTRSSIGVNADISIVPSLKRTTMENYNFLNYQSNNLDSVVRVDNDYNNKRSTIQLNGNYKYLLNKSKSTNLYLNFIYSYNPYSISNHLRKVSSVDGSGEIINNFNSYTDIINVSLIIADLVKSKKISTEFGLKSNTLNNNTNQVFKAQDTKFNYSEQLSSAFFSSRFKFGKYLVVVGVRGELLNSNSLFNVNNNNQEFDQNYFKIYPNLLLQKSFDNNLTASIGYTKKIRRPFLNDLNPSSRISSFATSFAGRIDYKPIFSDIIEAQLRYKELGLTFYYDQSSTRPVFLPTEDPFTYKVTNLNKLHKFAISADKGFKVSSFLSGNIVANYSYSKHEASDINYFRNGFNVFEITGSGDFILGKKTKLQVEIYYTAKMYTEYTVYRALLSNTLTLRQLLIKDKWSMNISLNDPFGLEKNKSDSFFDSQFATGKALSNQRVFSLQMVYNFPFGQKFKNQNYKKKIDGEIRDQQ